MIRFHLHELPYSQFRVAGVERSKPPNALIPGGSQNLDPSHPARLNSHNPLSMIRHKLLTVQQAPQEIFHEFLAWHVGFLPSVGRDDVPVGLGGVIDYLEDFLEIGGDALPDHGRTFAQLKQ